MIPTLIGPPANVTALPNNIAAVEALEKAITEAPKAAINFTPIIMENTCNTLVAALISKINLSDLTKSSRALEKSVAA